MLCSKKKGNKNVYSHLASIITKKLQKTHKKLKMYVFTWWVVTGLLGYEAGQRLLPTYLFIPLYSSKVSNQENYQVIIFEIQYSRT